MKNPLFLILLCVTFICARAQWQPVGPKAGQVSYITTHKGIVYAGLSKLPYGVYASQNNGINWGRVGNLIAGISDILFTDSLIVCGTLTGSDGRVYYKSLQGTDEWVYARPGTSTRVLNLARLGNSIIAATEEGIFMAGLRPTSWTKIYSDAGVKSICVFKNKIYACMSGGIYSSADTGKTFTPLNGSFSQRIFCNDKMIISSMDNSPYGVLVSTDGIQFTNYNAGLPSPGSPVQVIFKNDTAFALNLKAVYFSTDTGKNWNRYCTDYSLNPTKFTILNNQLFIAINQPDNFGGVFEFMRQTSSWKQRGLELYDAGALNADENYIYAGSGRINNNDDWQSTGMNSAAYQIKLFDTLLYYRFSGALYRSADSGLTAKSALNATVLDLEKVGNKWFATTTGKYIFSSTNWGKNWTPINKLNAKPLGRMISINGRLIIGSTSEDDSSYYTSDTGKTWKGMGDSLFRNVLWILPHNGKLYAQVFQLAFVDNLGYAIIVSEDGGMTWKRVMAPYPKTGYSAMYSHFNQVFISNFKGVYRATSDLKSWSYLVTAGHPDTFMNVVGMALRDSFIYVSLQNKGIWKTKLDGAFVSSVSPFISPSKKLSLEVYPNPGKGMVYINIPAHNAPTSHFRVLNAAGVEVKNGLVQSMNQGALKLDLSNLPAGIYCIQINSETKVYAAMYLLQN